MGTTATPLAWQMGAGTSPLCTTTVCLIMQVKDARDVKSWRWVLGAVYDGSAVEDEKLCTQLERCP